MCDLIATRPSPTTGDMAAYFFAMYRLLDDLDLIGANADLENEIVDAIEAWDSGALGNAEERALVECQLPLANDLIQMVRDHLAGITE